MVISIKKRIATTPAAPSGSAAPDPLPESFLTVKRAAHYAAVSEPSIRRWIKAKRLPCFRAGNQIRIDPRDIVNFMRIDDHG